MLTLAQINDQLRIDEDMGEDSALLLQLAEAAKIALEGRLNRTFYDDEATLAAEIEAETAPANALLINKAIEQAMLLLVGEMYTNREITVTGTIVSKNEFIFELLVDRYKYITEV